MDATGTANDASGKRPGNPRVLGVSDPPVPAGDGSGRAGSPRQLSDYRPVSEVGDQAQTPAKATGTRIDKDTEDPFKPRTRVTIRSPERFHTRERAHSLSEITKRLNKEVSIISLTECEEDSPKQTGKRKRVESQDPDRNKKDNVDTEVEDLANKIKKINAMAKAAMIPEDLKKAIADTTRALNKLQSANKSRIKGVKDASGDQLKEEGNCKIEHKVCPICGNNTEKTDAGTQTYNEKDINEDILADQIKNCKDLNTFTELTKLKWPEKAFLRTCVEKVLTLTEIYLQRRNLRQLVSVPNLGIGGRNGLWQARVHATDDRSAHDYRAVMIGVEARRRTRYRPYPPTLLQGPPRNPVERPLDRIRVLSQGDRTGGKGPALASSMGLERRLVGRGGNTKPPTGQGSATRTSSSAEGPHDGGARGQGTREESQQPRRRVQDWAPRTREATSVARGSFLGVSSLGRRPLDKELNTYVVSGIVDRVKTKAIPRCAISAPSRPTLLNCLGDTSVSSAAANFGEVGGPGLVKSTHTTSTWCPLGPLVASAAKGANGVCGVLGAPGAGVEAVVERAATSSSSDDREDRLVGPQAAGFLLTTGERVVGRRFGRSNKIIMMDSSIMENNVTAPGDLGAPGAGAGELLAAGFREPRGLSLALETHSGHLLVLLPGIRSTSPASYCQKRASLRCGLLRRISAKSASWVRSNAHTPPPRGAPWDPWWPRLRRVLTVCVVGVREMSIKINMTDTRKDKGVTAPGELGAPGAGVGVVAERATPMSSSDDREDPAVDHQAAGILAVTGEGRGDPPSEAVPGPTGLAASRTNRAPVVRLQRLSAGLEGSVSAGYLDQAMDLSDGEESDTSRVSAVSVASSIRSSASAGRGRKRGRPPTTGEYEGLLEAKRKLIELELPRAPPPGRRGT
ncbi:hypothetical protein WN55_06975 [Dufourea novaeangliae]|uniref:Uncharacterized protein n=1 Tax=Dufourea novaeangliae TaxID=178035 RepID=A0A154PSL8_DUFNO|nr:hypothetical protein WN55_06975 [Dufourea novaeangliae]